MDKNWIESLKEWFERKNGQLFSIYVLVFLISNWKFFYVLFISSSNQGGERIKEALGEFVTRTFLPWPELYVMQFVVPAMFTAVIIYFIPPFNHWAYGEWLRNRNKTHIMKHKSDTQLAKDIESEKREQFDSYASTEQLQSEINDLVAQINKLQDELTQADDAGSKAGNENTDSLTKLVSNPEIANLMSKVNEVIYSNDGRVNRWNGDFSQALMSADELQKADSFGLISFGNEGGKIALTATGKDVNRLLNS